MKPELNSELKARFFSQYHGQKVMADKQGPDKTFIVDPSQAASDRTYLKLRSLNAITDEEAIEINSILYPNELTNRSIVIVWITMLCKKGVVTAFGRPLSPHLVDYLRSKSFALPFMGYSVEELVQVGFVKLQE